MKTLHNKRRKGFTLIELLVVIGIVVILSVVVVLTLNPAQLLRQARDSTRVSDMATIKSALALYLSDVPTPDLNGTGAIQMGCSIDPQLGAPSGNALNPGNCNTSIAGNVRFATTTRWWTSSTNRVAVDSGALATSGWIPVNFASTTGGSPIAALPVDPINSTTTGFFYAFSQDATALTFEVNADMESTKYSNGGAGDVETSDGGNNTTLYEVGTDSGLDL